MRLDMKRLFLTLALLIGIAGLSLAQEAAGPDPVMYVTRYQLSAEPVPVYGLFDLGSKPSVRLVVPSLEGGVMRLRLHGRHYVTPVQKPFSVTAAFEDVTGRVFQQSAKIVFEPASQPTMPRWFRHLENIAGLYGGLEAEVRIPPGASVVNLLGNDENPASASPNQLVGYVSHIVLPGADSIGQER